MTITGASSFSRHVAATALVAGIPEGTCTISARAIRTTASDSLFPAPITQTVTITEGGTTNAQLSYQGVGSTSVRLFHGPLVFQGARTDAFYVPLSEYGSPETTIHEIDTYSFPLRVRNGCL